MEILASLDDIQTELDDNVAAVTDESTALLQIATARVVRGNLSGGIDNVTLQSWRTPDETPEIVRVAAAKLIAAQYYFIKISETTPIIDKDSFAQKRYDEAMAILNGILAGEIRIIDIDITTGEALSLSDAFPIDDTDRAFTMSKVLY